MANPAHAAKPAADRTPADIHNDRISAAMDNSKAVHAIVTRVRKYHAGHRDHDRLPPPVTDEHGETRAKLFSDVYGKHDLRKLARVSQQAYNIDQNKQDDTTREHGHFWSWVAAEEYLNTHGRSEWAENEKAAKGHYPKDETGWPVEMIDSQPTSLRTGLPSKVY